MNCKPGDLAVIVRRTYRFSPKENLGAIVEVTESAGRAMWFVKCSRSLKNTWGDGVGCCADADLQPIRPLGKSVTEGRDMEVTA